MDPMPMLTAAEYAAISVRAMRLIEAVAPPRSFRIRRCNGNKAAWCLIQLRPDGTEIDSYGGYTTSMSLDSLLARAAHLTPAAGDRVELVP